VVPEGFVGPVMGDLNSRRGRIQQQERRGNAIAVRSLVALAEMFGYATTLRSMTEGRGVYTMEPSHYEEVPKRIGEEIIARSQGRSTR
jgi:elongation factor G